MRIKTASLIYPARRGGARPLHDPVTGRTIAAPRIAGTMIHRPEGSDNRREEVIHRNAAQAKLAREATDAGFVIDRGRRVDLDRRVIATLRGGFNR